MSTKKTISHIFSVLSVIIFMLAVTPIQATHAAGVRYAKPAASGTGDCSSWANACTVQTALAGAVSGDEIWVATGMHKPTTGTDRATTFQLKNGVALYGGFAGTETDRGQRNPAVNVTTLSGDLNGDDVGFTNNDENVYHVVTGATGAILDGFTITKGNADCPCSGGGIYNNAGSPTLANLIFTGNSAGWGGGMVNFSSNPTLTNVTFNSNKATNYGGGMYNQDSSNPTLTSVTFSGNSANYGGGIFNYSSSPTLTSVTFSNNSATVRSGNSIGYGGGMYNYSSSPTLTSVTFSGNSADDEGGGMYNYSSSPIIADVAFNNNEAGNEYSGTGDGGGMYNFRSNPTLMIVIFNGNMAYYGGEGGGMYNESSSPTLTNVIFYGNTAFHTPSAPTYPVIRGQGGGMYNYAYSNPTLTNVTFSYNSAPGGNGGGIFNGQPDSGSNPVLTNVTFYYNSAQYGGGMYNFGSSPVLTNVTFSGNWVTGIGKGMYNNSSSNPQIHNSLFWTFSPIFYDEAGSSPNISDSVIENGCPSNANCTNIITANPMLGTFGNYGGFTQTIPLLEGSSAIDTGDDAVCPATDQRGVSRPQGVHCDIGAFEVRTYYSIYLPLILR